MTYKKPTVNSCKNEVMANSGVATLAPVLAVSPTLVLMPMVTSYVAPVVVII